MLPIQTSSAVRGTGRDTMDGRIKDILRWVLETATEVRVEHLFPRIERLTFFPRLEMKEFFIRFEHPPYGD